MDSDSHFQNKYPHSVHTQSHSNNDTQHPHYYRQQPLQEHRQQPHQEHRHQPSQDFRQQRSQEHRQQPSQDHRHQPPQDHRHQPSQDYKQHLSQEHRHQPSQEHRHQPSQETNQQGSHSLHYRSQHSQSYRPQMDQPPQTYISQNGNRPIQQQQTYIPSQPAVAIRLHPPQTQTNPRVQHRPEFNRTEPERTSQRLYQKRENYMRRTDSFKRQQHLALDTRDRERSFDGKEASPVHFTQPHVYDCCTADLAYMCSLSGTMKILQIILGIVVCCCAGIVCIPNTGCTMDVRIIGAHAQIAVVTIGAAAIVTSCVFFVLHICGWCAKDSWRVWEVPTLSIVLLLYIGAAGVESWYAGHRADARLIYAEQWATAAGFAWGVVVAYAVELSYWCCFYTKRKQKRYVQQSNTSI